VADRDAAAQARRTAGPPHVERLLAFTNSVDHEDQTDDLTTPAELVAWLRTQGLLEGSAEATTAELALARDLRDAVRDAMRAHHDGRSAPASLDRLAAQLPLRLDHTTGGPGLRPVADGVQGGLSWLIVAVTRAAADGSWERLKICDFDECQWAFYDASKNRSRHWCEWGCGNVVKTRNYRARRKVRAGD
jgi:predicted RNA-binding Zn ribbon-like protein